MNSRVWKLIAIVVIITMLFPLAGCAKKTETPPAAADTPVPPEDTDVPEPPTPTPVPEPTEFRIGGTYIWDGVNMGTAATGWSLWRLLFDAVVETGASGTYIPGLATEWSVDDSGLVWTFKIREGVTFHDGTPCTAEEVAWSLTWQDEIGFDSIAYIWDGLFEEVVAIDETTLQITTFEPIGYMEYIMFWAFVVPQSIWGDMTDPEEMSAYNELDATTGTGPYKAVDHSESEYLILEANMDYWGGAPPYDQVILQQFANEDAMVQALMAGEIDAIATVPATAVAALEADANVTVAIQEGWGVDELTLNSYVDGTQPASLGDMTVRKAIEYGIDREQINEVAYLGLFTPADSFIAPALPEYYNPDLDTVPFDPVAGSALLDEAGYVDSDGDDVREYSDGSPLEYRLLIDDAATSARIAEVIAAGLAQVGIAVNIESKDYDSQLNDVFYAYDFDMTYWWWGMDIDPDFGLSLFTTDQIWWWSDSGYSDPDYDAMYTASRVAVDKDERIALVHDMQEQIYEARPWIVLLYRTDVSAFRSDLFGGFNLDANYIFGKWSIMQSGPVN